MCGCVFAYMVLIMQFKSKEPQTKLISGRAEIWNPGACADIAHGLGLSSMLISLHTVFPKEIIKPFKEILRLEIYWSMIHHLPILNFLSYKIYNKTEWKQWLISEVRLISNLNIDFLTLMDISFLSKMFAGLHAEQEPSSNTSQFLHS